MVEQDDPGALEMAVRLAQETLTGALSDGLWETVAGGVARKRADGVDARVAD